MKSNPTAFILTTIIIAACGYWFFFARTAEQPALTPSPSQSEAQLRFQSLVSQLKPISFNTAIFSDPDFTSLVSLATPVAPETQGHLDPFSQAH